MPPPRLSLALIALMLGGCMSALQRPTLPVIDPQAGFSIAIPVVEDAGDVSRHWWRRATRETVWHPLETALTANPELRAADDNAEAARARFEQAEAALGPEIELDAGTEARRVSGDTGNNRRIGVDGDLPLDLNGALAERRRAARYAYEASLAERDQLQSDLARDYLLALLDRDEAVQLQALIAQQLDVAGTLLRLIELRFTQGLASSVDVLQQRDQLAALRQQIPEARLDAIAAGNRLRRVAAQTPNVAIPTVGDALPTISNAFTDIAPVALLQRRGLLRATQARIQAADARFAAALADRWPTFGLSGGLLRQVSSGEYSSIVTAALDAAFTLFDSGTKQAIAAERRAELAAAGEQHLSDWLDIVIRVDDLLNEEASLLERIALSEERLASSRALLDATQRRYERGISDYLPVLEALRGLQQQQRDHLALRALLAQTRIRLHHALGDPLPEDQA